MKFRKGGNGQKKKIILVCSCWIYDFDFCTESYFEYKSWRIPDADKLLCISRATDMVDFQFFEVFDQAAYLQ